MGSKDALSLRSTAEQLSEAERLGRLSALRYQRLKWKNSTADYKHTQMEKQKYILMEGKAYYISIEVYNWAIHTHNFA